MVLRMTTKVIMRMNITITIITIRMTMGMLIITIRMMIMMATMVVFRSDGASSLPKSLPLLTLLSSKP